MEFLLRERSKTFLGIRDILEIFLGNTGTQTLPGGLTIDVLQIPDKPNVGGVAILNSTETFLAFSRFQHQNFPKTLSAKIFEFQSRAHAH